MNFEEANQEGDNDINNLIGRKIITTEFYVMGVIRSVNLVNRTCSVQFEEPNSQDPQTIPLNDIYNMLIGISAVDREDPDSNIYTSAYWKKHRLIYNSIREHILSNNDSPTEWHCYPRNELDNTSNSIIRSIFSAQKKLQ